MRIVLCDNSMKYITALWHRRHLSYFRGSGLRKHLWNEAKREDARQQPPGKAGKSQLSLPVVLATHYLLKPCPGGLFPSLFSQASWFSLVLQTAAVLGSMNTSRPVFFLILKDMFLFTCMYAAERSDEDVGCPKFNWSYRCEPPSEVTGSSTWVLWMKGSQL